MDRKNILSKYDFFVTLVVTSIGTSIFSYPGKLSQIVGTDGWVVILLTGLLLGIFIYIAHKMIELSGYKRFTDIMEGVFGDILGKVFSIFILLSSVFIVSTEMRTFTEVLKMYLLKKTPAEFVILIMILVGTFLVRGEIESIVKFNEIGFWLMFVPIIVALPFVLKGTHITNILPIVTHKPIEYLHSIHVNLFSILGFQVIYLALPLVREKEESLKISFKSVIFFTIFYLIITITTLFVFPSKYNAKLLWPTISMLSTVNIPGAFIERWEGIIMAFWLIFYFTTFINLYYFACEVLRDVFNLEDVKIATVLISPTIYILSLYPENIAEVYSIRRRISPYIAYSMLGLTLLVLIIEYVKIGRRRNEI